MSKFKIILVIVLLLGAIAAYAIYKRTIGDKQDITVTTKLADFEMAVVTSGELEAKNSKEIEGPAALRTNGIYQVKIEDLVAEGSVVKKGDFIAELDKSEIATKISEAENELTKTQSQFEQIRLDTSLTLRQLRDELENLKFQLKEKQIVVEQSVYEPPATIRQAQLDLERTQKNLDQGEKSYVLKQKQSIAKMQEISASLNQTQNRLQNLVNLMNQFSIVAPDDGMVIYARDWNGKKKGAGTQIQAWSPIVATLPDLSVMISKTYINEVDIRKIKPGLPVEVSLDAFPEKKLTGTVTEVANVGEQVAKYDSKVFEVIVQITMKDTTLRPAMTTSNKIVLGKIKNVLSVPLESIHTTDSISYVYVKGSLGINKQQVRTGVSNENNIVILSGITAGDQVFLNIPASAEKQSVNRLAK
ncbi:MAG: HlyD family secretion protein [Bacteroidia bacterium]|nr:HlyD family secretion protein [Bacteroidia bacterium]